MKAPAWRESDLLALIKNGEKESLVLDYKRCDALGPTDGKKNEVSKDVSALANSAGGTIVYGMIEDGHVPVNLDRGYERGDPSKEWLEQVINSRIQRRIDGVVVHEVELEVSAPGRVAFVVSVPQSLRAPHQASDKRFYKRFNFESVPMEEYEVRDVSRRSEAPDLTMSFGAKASGVERNQNAEPHAYFYDISAAVSNRSASPANHLVTKILIDKRLALAGLPDNVRPAGDVSLRIGEAAYDCQCWHRNYSIPGSMPIFAGVSFTLYDGAFRVRVEKAGTYALGCQLLSPGMAPSTVGALLTCQGEQVEIVQIDSP